MMNEKKAKVTCTYTDAPQHLFSGHPESPERLKGLADWIAQPPYPEMAWLAFDPANESEVALVHHPTLLDDLKAEVKAGAHTFEPAPSYVTAHSYTAALNAVGATLTVSRHILAEGAGYGFAIVRPPGHHAEPDAAMGFCLLNNIAIAAADAVASGLERVAIFDFDAHHGNGTEAAFRLTPQVGFCSIHEAGIYPGTGTRVAALPPESNSINVPVPGFSGNAVMMRTLEEVVAPWLARFQPEMLLVSAGFDSHFSDPLTSLTVDTQGYYAMTRRLIDMAETWCEGRLLYVLEGGYDHLALRDNIQACLAALCGRPDYPDHYGAGPDVAVQIDPLIDEIIQYHSLKEI